MGLILSISIIALLLGGLATWNHCRNWGYDPRGLHNKYGNTKAQAARKLGGFPHGLIPVTVSNNPKQRPQ
jgi:uncharacterized protein DUF3309